MQHKLKRRLSAALMAGAMCCTMIPIASADEIATPETADAAVPEVTDNATPDISQITEKAIKSKTSCYIIGYQQQRRVIHYQ